MKLSTYMEKNNTNYREMAKKLKLDPSTVHKYASGARLPSLQTALKIEKLTKGLVPVKEFVRAS